MKNNLIEGQQDSVDEKLSKAAQLAIDTLIFSLQDENPKIRFDAAKDLLDRAGYGVKNGANTSGITLNFDMGKITEGLKAAERIVEENENGKRKKISTRKHGENK